MKTCSKCKIEKPKTEFCRQACKPSGLYSSCKDCSKALRHASKEIKSVTSKAYRLLNKELISEYWKSWVNANKERKSATDKLYREANKERISEYKQINKVRIASKNKLWTLANKDKVAEATKAWALANPDRKAENNRNRRARKLAAEGSHTSADIKTIFTSQRGLCANCKAKLFKSGKSKFHVDHITPLSKGGSNDKYNLQCLCPKCNLRKNAKDPLDWAKENGKLL